MFVRERNGEYADKEMRFAKLPGPRDECDLWRLKKKRKKREIIKKKKKRELNRPAVVYILELLGLLSRSQNKHALSVLLIILLL